MGVARDRDEGRELWVPMLPHIMSGFCIAQALRNKHIL